MQRLQLSENIIELQQTLSVISPFLNILLTMLFMLTCPVFSVRLGLCDDVVCLLVQ